MAIRILNNNYGGRVSISSRGLGGKFSYGADPVPTLLLDVYPGAAAAYSLRKLRTAYTGNAIRVRRRSDNTELDIGFTSSGGLDTTPLVAFVGGSDGYISKWYDQSGNTRDAIQTTALNQPYIIGVGTLQTVNGKPSIRFNYVDITRLTTSGILSGNQQRTQISLYKPISTSGVYGVFGQGFDGVVGTWSYIQARSGAGSGDPYFAGYGRDLGNGLSTLNTDAKIGTFIYDGTIGYLWKNNTQLTSGGLTLNTNVSEIFQIGCSGGGSGTSFERFDGFIPECILYTSNQTSNITAITNNINSYYSIY